MEKGVYDKVGQTCCNRDSQEQDEQHHSQRWVAARLRLWFFVRRFHSFSVAARIHNPWTRVASGLVINRGYAGLLVRDLFKSCRNVYASA